MEYISFSYNSTNALVVGSQDYLEFYNNSQSKNIVYFFFKDTECLYIGETENSIFDRCFVNTPKHKDKPWFQNANNIKIIVLESETDIYHRQLLENAFIVTYKALGHPLYNRKG